MADAVVDSALGTAAGVAVQYFDGSSARAVNARMYLRSAVRAQDRVFVIESVGLDSVDQRTSPRVLREVPWAELQWPERQRHGPRVAHLRSGGAVQCNDGAAWDAFALSTGRGEPWVVRAQQQWLATLTAALLLIALIGAGYVWGLPAASRGVVALVPLSVDQAIGEAALSSFSGQFLQPTELTAAEQKTQRDAFTRAITMAYPDAATRPAYDLRFHKSRIGPNAFALPGGTIVITDELVELVDHRADVITGVLAHEVGHVRQRHGMRAVVQFTLMSAVTSAAFGDFSSMLAAAPALLGQAAYSRDHEREADAESLHVMQAANLSPEAMVVFFEKIKAWQKNEAGDDGKPDSADRGTGFDLGIALSSHPADDERIAYFRNAAKR